jgi:uncharacterized membrane protein YphA (DoxX/SURF4 family)
VKIVNFILRLIVGGIFVASAVAKIGNVQVDRTKSGTTMTVSTNDLAWTWSVPLGSARTARISYVPDLATFAGAVGNYHVPPRKLTNLVAITLPWIELLAGGLLILGIWPRASAWTITFLMLVFLVAISWALAHGYDITCGCFGTMDARKVGGRALAEDAVLTLMAAWLAWRLKD